MNLRNYFGRVVVISLRRRADRLRRMQARMREVGWPFATPEVFDAIDGGSGTVPCPKRWISGGGAYGCQQSHIQVLQRALMDKVESLLVLEDDCEFRPTFKKDVQKFVGSVPSDWEALMIGGQHMAPSEDVCEGVVLCKNTQRTHAYAVRGSAIKDLCELWQDSRNHIDWDMGPFLGGRRLTYAPSPFLIGQAACRSDINGRRNPAKFWSPPKPDAPVLWLICPRGVAESLREYGIHYGANLDQSGNDVGLNRIFPAPGQYAGGIQRFVDEIQWECASFADTPGLCTIWHPHATAAVKERLVSDVGVTIVTASTLEEAVDRLVDVFGDRMIRKRKDQIRPPVLLIKSPAGVVSRLREEGLVHTGNWRNSEGVDMGLVQFFDAGGTSLRNWFSVLEKEAEWKNSIVGIWHPQATEDLAATTGRSVRVVDGEDYAKARAQVEEAFL